MHPKHRKPGNPAWLSVFLTTKSCHYLVAGSTGLEPAASGVTGRRSNQLNYDPELNA